MNAEFADTGEHSWKGFEYTLDVISSVHVRRVETGNHRIKSGLLFF